MNNKIKKNKAAERELKLREQYWPQLDANDIWKKDNGGFTSIPRALPLILQIMDDLSNNKPLSKVFLDLWCRDFNGYGFVTIANPMQSAFSSGFRGQRAITAWRERIKILKDLSFIDTKPGSSGEHHYILIKNPYHAIKQHKNSNTVGLREDSYNALYERALEIGIGDLD